MPSAPTKKWGPHPNTKHAPIFLPSNKFTLEVEETENNVEDVQPAEVHPEKDEVLKPAVEMPDHQGAGEKHLPTWGVVKN